MARPAFPAATMPPVSIDRPAHWPRRLVIPSESRHGFGPADSGLARYPMPFKAVEINSSFHRPRRAATYERWAHSVPLYSRFAVKLPRRIRCSTNSCQKSPGSRLGPLLVQLPPSFSFDARCATTFCTTLLRRHAGAVAWEARHADWFAPAHDDFLQRFNISCVAPDQARHRIDAHPGGTRALRYWRCGTPFASGFMSAISSTYWDIDMANEKSRNSSQSKKRGNDKTQGGQPNQGDKSGQGRDNGKTADSNNGKSSPAKRPS